MLWVYSIVTMATSVDAIIKQTNKFCVTDADYKQHRFYSESLGSMFTSESLFKMWQVHIQPQNCSKA